MIRDILYFQIELTITPVIISSNEENDGKMENIPLKVNMNDVRPQF